MSFMSEIAEGKWKTIREVTLEFAVTPRALRFYEKMELLQPHRGPGQLRLYSESDRKRLDQILLRSKQGFTLAEISAWLAGEPIEKDRLVEQREFLKDELLRINLAIAQLDNEILTGTLD